MLRVTALNEIRPTPGTLQISLKLEVGDKVKRIFHIST